MKVVWKHAPISTNEITDQLAQTTTWSPKTIQTLIKRLVTKGALSYEKQSRVFVYTPLVEESEYIRQKSSSFLNRYYDGDITAMLSTYIKDGSLSEPEIYDALFGLETGIITPEESTMAWNGADHPFEAWNADQNLDSAMKSSYWMESSLKISPIEQVQLLTKLYEGSFDFTPENVDAVKKSILLTSSSDGNFYGKTGTGRINEKDINGWFIGYVETADNTYFFATNIHSTENATGSKATEISLAILSDMGIWKQ